MMLLMGYLNEISVLNAKIAIPIGFIFYYLSFDKVYNLYVKSNRENQTLFYVMAVLWGLYGIAAMMPSNSKNASYNILDIFSKNFYGIYISYIVYTKRIK